MYIKNSKRFAYWTTCIVTALLCVFCIVNIIIPNQKYEYSGEYSFTPGVSVEEMTMYDGISLKPGVYYVELEYSADVFSAGYCTLYDGNVFTGGLLTNGEHLHANLDKTGFHVWLYEGTDTMEVRVSYGGAGAMELQGVTISETDKLWTMALTVILLAFGAVMLILRYRYYWNRLLDKEQKTVIWGILLITLLASYFPLTGKGLAGIDLSYHYMRIEGVKDGLLSGQFPVRIEPEWLFGQGFACGIFYCNGLLLIPAVFRLLGFSVVDSCNIYCVVLNFATAYISYYCFRKIFEKRQIGLVCSALYTLSVFRIYKLYYTGDFGESVAYTFLPLILYGYFRVFTEDSEAKKYRTAWIPLALGYAGVMQTHTLTCIIVGIWTVLICLICVKRILHLPTFLELLKGASAALGLSLWFLGPFLDYYLTQDVHIKNLTARTIQYRGLAPTQLLFYFWRNGSSISQGYNGMQYSYPVGVGLVLIVGLVLFLLIWFNRFPKLKILPQDTVADTANTGQADVAKGLVSYAKVGSLLAIVMLVMSLNSFPWDRLQGLSEITAPFISSLEFPARVIGSATAFLIIPFGFSLWYFDKTEKSKVYWGCVLVAVLGITTTAFFMSDHMSVNFGYYEVHNEEGMGFGFVSDGEYLMEGTPVSELAFEAPVYPEDVLLYHYEKEYLVVNMECKNTAGEERYVDVPMLNYRGYHAFCENGEELQIVNNPKMQIRVLLPAGFDGAVEIRFVSPIWWRICEVISLGMMIYFVVTAVKKIRERRSVSEKGTVS